MNSSESAAEIEKYQLAPLRKAILELKAQRAELDQAVQRLSGGIFYDQEGAVRRIERMIVKKDVHAVCKALDDQGLLDNWFRFGVPRVSLLDPGSKARVRRQVDQLKEALRKREQVDRTLGDKVEAYKRLAQTLGQPPSPFDSTGGGPPSDPSETTSQSGDRLWFRQQPKPDDAEEGASPQRESPWHRER